MQTLDLTKIEAHARFQNMHHLPGGKGFQNIWGLSQQQYEIDEEDLEIRGDYDTPFQRLDPRLLAETPQDYRVSWLGHATALIQIEGINVITDPVYGERVSPFTFAGPKRRVGRPVAVEDLPPIDAVVVSHNHYDHFDAEFAKQLNRAFQPVFFVTLGVADLLRSLGIEKVVEMDWWQYLRLGDVTFHCTPTKHFSGRWINDRNDTLWAGWFLEGKNTSVYFGGDSAYAEHYEAIRETIGEPEVAIIPIGAYQPRNFTREVHMDPREAVRTFMDLGARNFMGIHWGTYKLALEPFQQPPVLVRKYASREGASGHIHNLPVGGFIQS